jgi:very-short-patch-repair endonuclease
LVLPEGSEKTPRILNGIYGDTSEIGRYVVDFVNLENKLIIELDGGQHLNNTKDRIRDEWLRAEGYRVPRFWDNQIFNNLEGVLEMIRDVLLTPHPDPLPQGERGDSF